MGPLFPTAGRFLGFHVSLADEETDLVLSL